MLRNRPWTTSVIALAVALLLLAWKQISTSTHVSKQQHELVLAPQSFQTSLGVVGSIVPDRGIDILAPFDGTIRTVDVNYGDGVAAGQTLVVIDTSEIERQRIEAQQNFLRAQQTADEMADWDRGIDVARARRAVTSATLDVTDTERRMAETRALFDKGLVARSEFDSLQQQASTQKLALDAARQDYQATLLRGTGNARRAAALDFEAARARLSAVDSDRANAIVIAPTAGILVRPMGSKSDTPEVLRAGLRLAKGDLVGTISRPGALAVAFQLDESDVDTVRAGQDVDVTGPGFTGMVLHGKIVSVAGQAAASSSDTNTKASFKALARITTFEPAGGVRIGMSCNVSIVAYRNSSAIVVPAEAVTDAASGSSVMVKSRDALHSIRIPVQVGHVTPEGVEIRSGLKAGDTVVWTTPAPTAGAA